MVYGSGAFAFNRAEIITFLYLRIYLQPPDVSQLSGRRFVISESPEMYVQYECICSGQ